jgi:hypothetical protein
LLTNPPVFPFGFLLRAAKHVTACDFMEVSIAENRRQHKALGNVSFMVADVTELEQVRLFSSFFDKLRCSLRLCGDSVQAVRCSGCSAMVRLVWPGDGIGLTASWGCKRATCHSWWQT